MERSHNDLNDREMTIAKQASPLLGTLTGTVILNLKSIKSEWFTTRTLSDRIQHRRLFGYHLLGIHLVCSVFSALKKRAN